MAENNISKVMKYMAGAIVDNRNAIEKAHSYGNDAARIEAIRNNAPLDKGMVEIEKASGDYGFADARRDYADGGTTKELLWDKSTCKQFVDYAMSTKAAGPYTETTTAGGYLVPTSFKPELIRLAYVKSVALQEARIIEMAGNSLNMPTLATQATMSWGTINTSIGDTANVFGQMSLSAEKAVAFSLAPNELIHDSPISVAQMITDNFTEAMAKFIDEEFFTGDTADASNHKFNGWEFAASVHDTAGDTGDSVAGVLTHDNIIDTMGLLDAVEIQGAKWFMHPSTWAIVRKLKDSQNMPLVPISGGYKYDLAGYPVTLSNQVSATAASIAADRAVALFGNPKYGFIGDCLSLSIDSSDQYKFQSDQTAFRCVQRFAIDFPLGSSLAMITRGPA